MIELYLSKVTENSELETAGKYYAKATMGTLAEGQKTGPAVKVVKLLAQSTGIVGNVEERILNRMRSILKAIDLRGGAVDGLLRYE